MNSKERFSNRVDRYVKYRPGYPKEAVDYLYDTAGLRPQSEVADIGAGTGIFSQLLLERGNNVIAVEPNGAMRDAAVQSLGHFPNFRAVSGSAEETGLPAASVDFIVCAQSFHWFDRPAAQREFRTILKPGGRASLIWNTLRTTGTPFLEQYNQLLHTYSIDYVSVQHRNISAEALASFFRVGNMQAGRFANRQLFDLDGLIGRLLSSSFSPLPGHPNYDPMMDELHRIFEQNEENGQIALEYETEVYWGEM